MANAYFERLGPGRFHAGAATASPWGANLQHGSPPTTLLVHALNEAYPRDDVRVARVSSEFLGAIPQGEIEVTTRVVRPGKRIEFLEATLSAGGRDVVRTSIWRIARAPGLHVPPGVTPADAPPPRPPEATPGAAFGLSGWGYAKSIEWRFVEGGFNALGPAHVWTRVDLPLFPGLAPTPLERLLLIVDSANGISGELPFKEWLFVPPSLSIALAREPRGEWIYMDARTALGDDGGGVTTARLADDDGYLGVATQTLFVEPRTA
ncbi:MAG TPA: thioesterase family protein [Candidatus Sulfotelmatobacter sp.]|nr:thioesterase family protein [Candidatus Sulfotelmatobacter sp.]